MKGSNNINGPRMITRRAKVAGAMGAASLGQAAKSGRGGFRLSRPCKGKHSWIFGEVCAVCTGIGFGRGLG